MGETIFKRIQPDGFETDTLQLESTSTGQINLFGYIELLLKDRRRLGQLLLNERRSLEALPNLLGVAIVGFAVYGLIISIVFRLSGSADTELLKSANWFVVTLSYTFGLIGAVCVCLPSFYFYALLAGVRASMAQVAAQSVRALATTALLLLGIMPIYVVAVIGLYIGGDALRNEYALSLSAGFALPFIAGLFGVITFYRGFVDLSNTLPSQRHRKCGKFLRFMAVCQSGLYAVVAPAMIYTLLNSFGRFFNR